MISLPRDAADVVDRERLVLLVLADAAAREPVRVRAGARAHVQVERLRVPRGRGPVGGAGADRAAVLASRGSGEVDRLRQLDGADVEVRRRAEGEEEEVDPHLDRRDEVDGAGAVGA